MAQESVEHLADMLQKLAIAVDTIIQNSGPMPGRTDRVSVEVEDLYEAKSLAAIAHGNASRFWNQRHGQVRLPLGAHPKRGIAG